MALQLVFQETSNWKKPGFGAALPVTTESWQLISKLIASAEYSPDFKNFQARFMSSNLDAPEDDELGEDDDSELDDSELDDMLRRGRACF